MGQSLSSKSELLSSCVWKMSLYIQSAEAFPVSRWGFAELWAKLCLGRFPAFAESSSPKSHLRAVSLQESIFGSPAEFVWIANSLLQGLWGVGNHFPNNPGVGKWWVQIAAKHQSRSQAGMGLLEEQGNGWERGDKSHFTALTRSCSLMTSVEEPCVAFILLCFLGRWKPAGFDLQTEPASPDLWD